MSCWSRKNASHHAPWYISCKRQCTCKTWRKLIFYWTFSRFCIYTNKHWILLPGDAACAVHGAASWCMCWTGRSLVLSFPFLSAQWRALHITIDKRDGLTGHHHVPSSFPYTRDDITLIIFRYRFIVKGKDNGKVGFCRTNIECNGQWLLNRE